LLVGWRQRDPNADADRNGNGNRDTVANAVTDTNDDAIANAIRPADRRRDG
jgi:hypothetical protein